MLTVVGWNPIALLFDALRLNFEMVTAEKVRAFEEFSRRDGESAMEAAGRFRDICRRANKQDNDRKVAKWMNSLLGYVRAWVEADSRYRTTNGLLPDIEVVLQLIGVAEIHQALWEGVELGGDRSRKGKEKEKEKEGDKKSGERGSNESTRRGKWEPNRGRGKGRGSSALPATVSFSAVPVQTRVGAGGKTCFICAGDHLKKDCPKLGQNLTCYSCQGKGHLAAACRGGKAGGNGQQGGKGANGKGKVRSPSETPATRANANTNQATASLASTSNNGG